MQNILICTYDQTLIPTKGTPDAVCWDIKCASDFSVAPGTITTVGMGIKAFLPTGRGARMYARSSLPTKTGLMIANAVAVFDADYRGEYLGQFYNFTSDRVQIPAFTRLLQLEFFPYLQEHGVWGSPNLPTREIIVNPALYERFADEYPSERGVGGIGSTG